MVPHHPPKVPHGSRQRILGNDELAAVFVTLQEVNHSVTLKLALLYTATNQDASLPPHRTR